MIATVVHDRLRAAAEFRRAGLLHDALINVMWARSNRLIGRDAGTSVEKLYPNRYALEGLAMRCWRRQYPLAD